MKNILLVDDSVIVTNQLKNLLQANEYEVSIVHDGESAFKLFEQNEFCCVITDVNMPGWSGIDLISKIRQIDKGKTIPVVVLSSTKTNELKKVKKQLNIAGWMIKPFNEEVVLAFLNKIL